MATEHVSVSALASEGETSSFNADEITISLFSGEIRVFKWNFIELVIFSMIYYKIKANFIHYSVRCFKKNTSTADFSITIDTATSKSTSND